MTSGHAPPPTPAETVGARGSTSALAALLFLALALFVFRAVLPAPWDRLPHSAALYATQHMHMNLLELDHHDQRMVVSTVTRNAHKLTHAPDRLFEDGQCHPTPMAHTLGEHMFGLGLLATIPYALSGDPVFSFNAALVLTLWIPAWAMFLLVREWTRRPDVAIFCGAAAALVPLRLLDPSHPYVHGDLWVPLVLLYLYRCFARPGLRNALGLTLFGSLQICESLYPILTCALYSLVLGATLGIQYRRDWRRILPWLVPPTIAGALVASVVLGPYLETRATWDVLGSVFAFPAQLWQFGPGELYFPGWVVSALAVVGLGTGERSRVRVALLLGALAVLWTALGDTDVFGVTIPSLRTLLLPIVPGLDAIRAIAQIAAGASIGMIALAGFGLARLTRDLSRSKAAALVLLFFLPVLATRAYGPLSRATFGRLLRTDAWAARPPAADIDAFRRHAEGAVLDLPMPERHQRASHLHVSHSLLLNSFSPRATGTCYNSFTTPVQDQVARLASELPDPQAAEDLATLGFRTVVLHKQGLRPTTWKPIRDRLDTSTRLHSGFGRLEETDSLAVYRLQPTTETHSDWAPLATDETGLQHPLPRGRAQDGAVEIPLVLRNTATATFRHPPPVTPSDLILRWFDARTGVLVQEDHRRALLPLAIPKGGERRVMLQLTPPDPAAAQVLTLSRAAAPTDVLAQTEVLPPGAESPGDADERLAAALLTDRVVATPATATTGAKSIEFTIRNSSRERLVRPEGRPLPVIVRWLDKDGEPIFQEPGDVPLPPRIEAGEELRTIVPLIGDVAPGHYLVVLAPWSHPARSIGSRVVEVQGKAAAR